MKIIGVLGAGSMGSGIAQIAASNGCKVLLFDTNPKALISAIERLKKILNRLVEKQKINEDKMQAILALIITTDNLNDFKNANLVIEAIIEDLEIKKKVF